MAAACAATLGLGWGCGGSPDAPSSHEQATVHGTVKIEGKHATSGTVEFNPANVNRKDAPSATSPIGNDGTYSVKTLVGGNAITVTAPEITKKPVLERAMPSFDVQSGDNTFNIEISPPGG
jgi:hypothetical protein